MRKLALYILIGLIPLYSLSQEEIRLLSIYDNPNQLVSQLSDGAILVRLNTGEKQLELLQKMKLTQKYAELKKEIIESNEEVIEAFSKKLTYIKHIYYFSSSHSNEIREGNFDGFLLNDELKTVPRNDLIINTYVIAEFAKTEQMGIPALVVYNNQFEQLEAPFPYFVRTYESLPIFNRSYDRTVELFDERLRSYQRFHP
jgi:hypothetical protein